MCWKNLSIASLTSIQLSGCGGDDPYQQERRDPFGQTAIRQQQLRIRDAKATQESALRVASVGKRLVRTNDPKKRDERFIFQCIGAPQSAIFHKSPNTIIITEGLVKKCKTEGELAAVLSIQMGKLISEREVLAGNHASDDRLPPIDVPIGPDSAGPFGSPDGTRMMELAKYEKQRRMRRRTKSTPPPDPMVLARSFLKKGGFTEKELESAKPLIKEAAQNVTLERQMKGGFWRK